MADTPQKVTVRLSIQPGEDVEVPVDELPSLRHQGLLLSVDGKPEPGKEPPAQAPATPAVAKPAAGDSKKAGAAQ